jgi:hypothetical protein
MDNIQNCDSYINIPSSQTYGSKTYTVLLNAVIVLHIIMIQDLSYLSVLGWGA